MKDDLQAFKGVMFGLGASVGFWGAWALVWLNRSALMGVDWVSFEPASMALGFAAGLVYFVVGVFLIIQFVDRRYLSRVGVTVGSGLSALLLFFWPVLLPILFVWVQALELGMRKGQHKGQL